LNEVKKKSRFIQTLKVVHTFLLFFFEAEHDNSLKLWVSLSAISFYSTSLHKKDAAAIEANLEAPVFRG